MANKILKPGKAYNNNTDAYDIQVGPGTRFFFFQSLTEKAKHNSAAQKILSQAYNAINIGTDIVSNNFMFEKSVYDALQLLYNMYEFEREKEISVFQTRLLPLLTGKYESFKDCITTNHIDYIRFMALLKLLENDNKDALELLKDQYNSLKNLNEGIEKAIPDIKQMAHTQLKVHRSDIIEAGRASASGKTTPQLANDLAALARDVKPTSIVDIKSWLETNLLNSIMNGQTKITKQDPAYLALLTDLIRTLRDISATISPISNAKNVNSDRAVRDFLDDISKDTKEKDKLLKRLQTQATDIMANMDILEAQGEILQHLLSSMGPQTKIAGQRAFGFTKAIRRKLAKMFPSEDLDNWEKSERIEVIKKDANGNPIETKKFKANILHQGDFEKYISILAQAMDIKNPTLPAVLARVEHELASEARRKESITANTEYISATWLNKISNKMGIEVAEVLDGYKNLKNDASSVVVLGKLAVQYNQLDPHLQQQILDTSQALLEDFDKQYYLELHTLDSSGFDAKAQTIAEAKLEQQYVQSIINTFSQQGMQIQDLSDILIVDDSAKFAETFFVQEGGFTGGSLGANIEKQINNILYMLDVGGITHLDAERLLSATLNAGDGMIGAFQRPALENFFSTVASMLMFKTGGNALRQWALQARGQASNEPSRIHIYTFGTYYVPESYILYKTWEGLNKCASLLTQEASSYGSRVYIYNPVNEQKNKQQKTFYSQKNETDVAIPDWEDTAEKGFKLVHLDMMLLGGFLDVVEQINKIMQSYIQ